MTPWTIALQTRIHGDSPGKNTGVGCHDLLQGIFPTQGSNPGLSHCRRILYQLSYQGSPGNRFGLLFYQNLRSNSLFLKEKTDKGLEDQSHKGRMEERNQEVTTQRWEQIQKATVNCFTLHVCLFSSTVSNLRSGFVPYTGFVTHTELIPWLLDSQQIFLDLINCGLPW